MSHYAVKTATSVILSAYNNLVSDLEHRINWGDDSAKPATPNAGDRYIALDTKKVYYCFTAESWEEISKTASLKIGGDTNYAEIKTDGEINLHGTARITKEIYLNNAAFTKGSTAPTQVILGDFNAWEFDIGDDAVMTIMLPADWASGTDIIIKVCWYIDEAYSADKEIQWRIDWSALPHDFTEAVDSPTHSGQIDSGDINIPVTAKYMGVSTVGTIVGASLSANDMLGFVLSRIAVTNDDPTADPHIHHLIVEYTADKLGIAT